MEQFAIFSTMLGISNIVFFLIIITILGVLIGNLNISLIPNNWGILSESSLHTIMKMLENFVNPKAIIYLPLFYSIGIIILLSNFIGLIPYTATPTVEIILTLSMSFTLLIGFAILGFQIHGFKLLAIFLPAGSPQGLIPLMIPLEIIAYLSRTQSLGLRLAINLITGHILIKVITGFIYLGFINGTSKGLLVIGLTGLIAFICLEILVAYLQCYIFLFISL